MNPLDGAILAILAVGAWRGYRKGLLVTVISMGSYLGAMAAAFAFYKALGALLQDWGLVAALQKWYLGKLPIPEIVKNFPSRDLPYVPLDIHLSKLPLPEFYQAEMARFFKDAEHVPPPAQALTVGEAIANYLALSTVNLLSFLLLLIGVERLVRFLTHAYSRALKDTLLGLTDRLGGLAAGALLGFVGLSLFAGWVNSWLTAETAARYGPLGQLPPMMQGSLVWPWLSGFFQLVWDRISHFTFR